MCGVALVGRFLKLLLFFIFLGGVGGGFSAWLVGIFPPVLRTAFPLQRVKPR